MPGIYVLQSPMDTGDNTLPVAVRDPVITGANGGVKLLFDLAFPWCYPGGVYAGRPAAGAPAAGATIYDMSETGNASFNLYAGETISYAGGGFDFGTASKIGSYIQGSGALATSIWNATNQYFLLCLYMKLPTQANWFSNAGIDEIWKFAATPNTYQSGTELALMAFSSGALSFRRQNGAGTADIPSVITPQAADFGGFAQLACWRDSTGFQARVKTPNGAQSVSMGAAGVNNTQNFSGLTAKIGMPPGFSGANGAVLNLGLTNAGKFRIYRGFGEDLSVSGRSAITVLDADYARTVARGVFS